MEFGNSKKGEKRLMVNTKITIRKTFENSKSTKTFDISGDFKNASDEAKREIINELFTEKQIETIWNGVKSYASYLDYEKQEYEESKKYKKLSWIFYP